jgi:hypothetical protein
MGAATRVVVEKAGVEVEVGVGLKFDCDEGDGVEGNGIDVAGVDDGVDGVDVDDSVDDDGVDDEEDGKELREMVEDGIAVLDGNVVSGTEEL